MTQALDAALKRLIATGSLRVAYASGRVETYGAGGEAEVAVRFADPAAERALLRDPLLALGELYMDGRFRVERGSIYDFLSLVKRNGVSKALTPSQTSLFLARSLARRARRRLLGERAKRNVAHHYDLEAGLFDLFLDADKQYSCAYFETGDETLEAAQLAKKRHIAAKLLIKPGNRVLDIGCGWGGMALYLASVCGADVTGITLSENQLAEARRRADAAGLSGRVRFALQDYRAVEGTFERIVSVGMFEHVGLGQYPTFFRTLARLLERGSGVAVLHSIGRPRPRFDTDAWTEKYIFPGGYIPALSQVLPAAERAGLLVKDVEVLPIHYARTLRHWRERFLARADEAIALYDERFVRMWEFYLAASETAFRHERLFVFQLQLARHQDAVPYTRGYIAEAEAALLAREGAQP